MMLRVCIVTTLLIFSSSIKLNVPSSGQITDLNNYFSLACTQASGPITYSFQGLPTGFQVQSNQLVYNGNIALQGQFPVKITATDASGKTDQTIVLLSVNLSGTGSAAYNNSAGLAIANSFLNQNAAASVPSSTSSSSSAASSSSSSSSGSGGSISISGNSSLPSSGAQILTLNGVNYNFGNSLSLNLGNTPVTAPESTSDLISEYATGSSTTNTTTNYGATYPTPSIPTGPVPNSGVNTNVISITTAQASLNNGPTNNITAYDLNITDLFYQQTQVGQTIANLLQIIRTGTANRNQAQSDITLYTQQLNQAEELQQNLSVSISAAAQNVNGIQSAIQGANTLINNLNVNLTNVNGQINAAKTSGLGLTQQLSIAINNRDGIQTQVNQTQGNINNIQNVLGNESKTCDQTNQVIATLNLNISTLQASILGVDDRVAGINSQIANFTNQIAALQKQIDALNANITQSQQQKQNLINLNYTVPQQVANLNAQIAAQQAICSSGGYNKTDLINAQNGLTNLNNQLTNANNVIVNINTNITLLKNNLNNLLNQSAQIGLQINKAQSDLATLKAQLPIAQSNLSSLYISGNNALKAVNNANSSLIAATARFNSESSSLTVASINLETARTQQATINQQINVILQQNTVALPFPSAPSSLGLNSTLSSVNQIDSITAYLLRAYGSGLSYGSLSSFSNIKYLYTFGNFNSLSSNCPQAILSGSSTSSNSANSTQLAGEGTISAVNGNVVQVTTSAGVQQLNLGNCSIRLSNIQNYTPKVGDTIVFKGNYNSNSQWNASYITCLSS